MADVAARSARGTIRISSTPLMSHYTKWSLGVLVKGTVHKIPILIKK